MGRVTKSQLLNSIEDDLNSNGVLTENGAKTLKSTKDSVLDLFSRGAAYRTRSENEAIALFRSAYASDRDLAMKALFYIRDIRGGQGERKVFRTILGYLATFSPESVKKNFVSIAEMGRWDDFFVLRGTPLEKDAFEFLHEQWRKDIEAIRTNADSISLLGKWAPSANASSKETKKDAVAFYTFLGITERQYRKTLSHLREKLKLVERAMSSKHFGDIDYSKVPSRASLLYRKSFGKQDTDRYGAYLKALEKGEVKVNASTLYPYDLVRPILRDEVTSPRSNDGVLLDAQWKALPNFVPEGAGNALVVADVSGSMHSSNYLPISTSVALALYFAERNDGLFAGHFITFSNEPALVKVQGSSLVEKVTNLSHAQWDMNTNLQAVFELLLKNAVAHSIPEEEMPTRIFIISDMEFDQAIENPGYGARKSVTNFDAIDQKYIAAGYKRPLIVFWNVEARNDQSPVKFDQVGTMLVSGQSPSIFKAVMESKVVTPFELMLEVLNKPRYEAVLA